MGRDGLEIEGQPFNVLYDMAHGQSASRQRASAEGWRQLARMFEALSGNLTHYRDEVAPDWYSKGGEAFRGKMTDVVKILDDYAADIRVFATILDDTADAVVIAQQEMNKLNNTREQYVAEKEDYRDNGDGSDSWWLVDGWRDAVDVTNDTWHRITGDSHIDAARMRQFDEQARAIMTTLSNAYLAANTKRPTLAEYKGPIIAVPIPNVPGVPGTPDAPGAPTPPAVPVIPPTPPPVNPLTSVPPPMVPPAPPPGQGPVLAGTPASPTVPTVEPPVAPPAPNPPGVAGTPVPPLLPGLNVLGGPPGFGAGGGGAPKLTPPPTTSLSGKGGPKSGPGLPPPPGPNAMKRSGVIGQKPGAGAQGKPAIPPAAGSGKGVIGKRPADGSRRGGQPPAAGERSRPGTPPPAQRRDRRNADNQPSGPEGMPGTIGPAGAAWGTPPPTIGNTSRPTRPTSLDHDAIGGRPPGGSPRRQQPGADGPEHSRRPGLAARDAAPPVLGRKRPAQPKTHGEPPPARRSQHRLSSAADDYGVAEHENVSPVIQTPERHEHDERGPAIGQAG